MFDSLPPNVSKTEFFDDLIRYLEFAEFSEKDITNIKLVFEPLLDMDGRDRLRGIDAKEIELGIKSLIDNHELTHKKAETLKNRMITYLKK